MSEPIIETAPDPASLDQVALVRAAFESAPVALRLCDAEGKVLIANAMARRNDSDAATARDGEARPALLERREAMAIGDQSFTIAAATDVSENQKLQDELFRSAYFDELTGCPNGLLFGKIVQQLIDSTSDGQQFAVVAIDIDQFCKVNDFYGRAIGDEILAKFAGRISAELRAGDMLARTGDDEFMLLLSPIDGLEAATAGAERILGRMREPFVAENFEIFVVASAGQSIFPIHETSVQGLREKALLALSQAKRSGGGSLSVFDPAISTRLLNRARLEQNLRIALRERQFLSAFQPKVDFRAGRVVGAEVLMRWRDEDGTMRTPGEAIALALNLGLMNDITSLMFEQTLAALDSVESVFGQGLTFGFNVAAKQAGDLAYMRAFAAMLGASGQANRFFVELTEEALLMASQFRSYVLPMLREVGARISIDDFGLGISSLSTLADLAPDEIKVDGSFIAAIHRRPRSQTILRAIELMAQAMEINVMAEGVETVDELGFLMDSTNIRVAQGFYFGQPAVFSGFEAISPSARGAGLVANARLNAAIRTTPALRRVFLRSA